MRGTIAIGFLVLAWLFPLVASLIGEQNQALTVFWLPSGSALHDSNRTLLFAFCSVAVCLASAGRIQMRGLTTWASLFLGWTVLSSLFGSAPVDSLLFSLTWYAATAAFASTRVLSPEKWNWQQRLSLLHLPVGLIAALALAPLALDPTAKLVTGPFKLANVYSNWMIMLVPLLVYELYAAKSWRGVAVTLASSSLALTSLVFTNSRTAWLLAPLAISVGILAVEKCRGKRLWTYLAVLSAGTALLVAGRESLGGVGFILSLAALFLAPALVEPVLLKRKVPGLKLLLLFLVVGLLRASLASMAETPNVDERAAQRMDRFVKVDNSTRSRIEFWKSAARMTAAHPVLGTGPSTFSQHYPTFQQHYYYYSDSPHATSLELSSELGLAGLILFSGCLVCWLRDCRSSHTLNHEIRRMALVGVMFGLAHAQTDVTYQFADLWVTLAILAAVAAGPRSGESGPNAGHGKKKIGVLLLALPFLFYLAWIQRTFERSAVFEDDRRRYHLAALASRKLPGWTKPSAKALQIGLELSRPGQGLRALPLDQLAPLVRRLLSSTTHSATAHLLAGRYYRRTGREKQALKQLQTALSQDHFNFPRIYHELFLLYLKAGDTGKAMAIAERALETYDLSKLRLAHTAHRDTLLNQLVPFYFDLADTLNPYQQPQRTEPLYRFIVEHRPNSPRALYGLGTSLLTLGKKAEGIPLLQRAHQLNPLFPAPTK